MKNENTNYTYYKKYLEALQRVYDLEIRNKRLEDENAYYKKQYYEKVNQYIEEAKKYTKAVNQYIKDTKIYYGTSNEYSTKCLRIKFNNLENK